MGYVIKAPTGFTPYFMTATGGYTAQLAHAKVFLTEGAARRAMERHIDECARRGQKNMSGPLEVVPVR